MKAAIGPGLFAGVGVQVEEEIAVGVRMPVRCERQVTLAFGERDLLAGPKDELAVELDADGPWVVDVPQAITKGVKAW